MLIVIDERGRIDADTEKAILADLARSDPDYLLTTPIAVKVGFRPMLIRYVDDDKVVPNREQDHREKPDNICSKCGRLWGDHIAHRFLDRGQLGCRFYL